MSTAAHRWAGGALVVVTLVPALTACSSGPGGETTCAKYAALSDSKQRSVLENTLKEKHLDPIQWNALKVDVMFYCKIPAGSDTPMDHANDPISSTPSLSE